MREIANEELRLSDIPSTKDKNIWVSSWRDFALTFDGYDYASRSGIESLLSFSEPVHSYFEEHKTLHTKLTLSELRACLFMTQRMWRGSGEDRLSKDDKALISSLIEAIRKKIIRE